MFVVVFVKSVKKKFIVPEQWIYGVDEESLKNNGVNSNKSVLIFWSDSIDADGYPDATFTPNFTAPNSMKFPPPKPNKQACYVGRSTQYHGE